MNQRGLTLIEVLIALGVFAAVSALGVAALSLTVSGSDQLQEVDERIGDLERFRGLLRSDLRHLVDRPVLEPDTEQPRPAFVGGRVLSDFLPSREGTALLALVRSGWANPGAEEPRSELQAITWLIKEGALIRRQRPFLDAVADTPTAEDILLSELRDIDIAFLDGGRWRDEAGRGGTDSDAAAMRITFEHPVYGPMEHVFLVGGPE
ncbi:MAG: type II secretion system minor pseudopilin GspJ [Pseudomonadota bacterium]